MKGLVFNALESAITAGFSAEVWDELLDRAGLEGSYTSLGNYDDSELYRIIGAASDLLGLPPDQVQRRVGRLLVHHLAEPHQELRAECGEDPGVYLRMINERIHREMVTLYPDASLPTFDARELPDGATLLHYRSHRRLVQLATGMLEGVADDFDCWAEITTQPGDDDSHVVFEVRFHPINDPSASSVATPVS